MSKDDGRGLDWARSWWWHRQGLGLRGDQRVEDALARGWCHVASAPGPHLSCLQRMDGLRRADVDQAVYVRGTAVHVHTARGAGMVVPASDRALALWLGREQLARMLAAAKVGEPEVEAEAGRILELLADDELQAPDIVAGLRPAPRPLGPDGAKIGAVDTAILSLRWAEANGLLRRTTLDRRLDGKRFAYARCDPPAPLDGDPLAMVAARWLLWAAPGTAADFAEWAGCKVEEARRALDGVPTVRVDSLGVGYVPDAGDPPEARGVALLPYRDNLPWLRKDVAILADPELHARPAPGYGGRPSPLGKVRRVHAPTVVEDGRLVGTWAAHDGEVAVDLWTPVRDPGRLAAEVERVESFVRVELGGVAVGR